MLVRAGAQDAVQPDGAGTGEVLGGQAAVDALPLQSPGDGARVLSLGSGAADPGEVLAAPGVRRPEVRDPTKSARRAATLSELT